MAARHKDASDWKEEYNIIHCEECGCDVKTTTANRKYCFDCRRKRLKNKYVRKTPEPNYEMNLRRVI